MRQPIGPFIGAIVFVLLQTFAIDLIDGERFNTLIGLVFLAIVLVFARRAARPVGATRRLGHDCRRGRRLAAEPELMIGPYAA